MYWRYATAQVVRLNGVIEWLGAWGKKRSTYTGLNEFVDKKKMMNSKVE